MLNRIMRRTTRRRLVLMLAGLTGISSFSGCSRQFWRTQADRDSYAAIGEKVNDAHWEIPRYEVNPDSRSRFYDPYDPDKPPLPPDDPTAHEFMHSVNGRKGYKNWHKLGVSFSLENPQWLSPYGLYPEGVDPVQAHSKLQLLKVSLPAAMDLASIHSREYQTSIEDLYLSALSLTAERFKLGVRYLGTGKSEPTVGLVGSTNASGTAKAALATPFGMSQALPTGGQIAVDIANSVTWVFSGNGSQSSAPSLGYSLTQPLLFQAGRKIALESLTQSERSVLYDVRTLARFRQSLFTQITAGYLNLLLQRQNILNTENNIRLLEEQLEAQQVRDTRVPGVVNAALDNFQNLQIPADLQGQLSYDGNWLKWRGDLTDAQERQVLSLSADVDYQSAAMELIDFKKQQTTSLSYLQLLDSLNQSLTGLATSKRLLADQQDSFKLTLGLPPNMTLEVDETLLKPFELISWDLINLETDLRKIQKDIGERLLPKLSVADGGPGPELSAVRDYLTALAGARDSLQEIGIEQLRRDFEPLNRLMERTQADVTKFEPGERYFRTAEERQELEARLTKDLRLFRLAEREFAFGSGLLTMLQQLVQFESQEQLLKALDKDGSGKLERMELPEAWGDLPRSGDRNAADAYTVQEFLIEVASGARDIRDKYLLRMSQSLEVLQASLRVEQLALVPFSLDQTMRIPDLEEVVALGLEYRHDLMNARAAVMDKRRQVEIQANRLEAGLDVTFRGTQGLNPDGRGNTNHSAGVQFTTPLDQVLERNGYRQSIVEFQRARRSYMDQEDRVKQSIRQSWRQIQVQEYRIQVDRTAVRNAAVQYDSASLQAQGAQQGNALSLQNALGSVLRSQNQLASDWVTYETNRLNIFRDMGIMEIDPRGVWTDRFYLQMQSATAETVNSPAATPDVVPPVPAEQDTVPAP
ncbi:MAG: TolC family protein [Planctomycetia bacterium]